jgi:peroxiredoxin/uncharacterized membrane protein YphA (DoxX/SURF4 family)
VESVALGARVVLAIVFAAAAAGKLADQRGARRALADFGMPDRSLATLALLLPLAELGTAGALLAQPSARWGAAAALGLLLVFVGGIAGAMARGREPDCHCFGQLSSGPVGRGTVLRNVLLAVPAVLVVAYGAGEALDAWVEARSPAELVAAGAGIAAVALTALCLRRRQEDRSRRRDVARLRSSGAERPPGLPIGASAPHFTLATVEGQPITLSALLERGKPVALLFLSAGCPSCVTMLPDVARWQSTLDDRLTISIVTAGAMPEIEHLAEEHGLTNVLVEDDHEVFGAYRAVGTPSGVIITPDGRIASQTNATKTMVETLIRHALHRATTLPGKASVSLTGGSLAVHHRSNALGRH